MSPLLSRDEDDAWRPGTIGEITPWHVMFRRRPATTPRAVWARVVDGASFSSAMAKVCAYLFGVGVVSLPAYVIFAMAGGVGLSKLWLMITLGIIVVGMVGYLFFYAAIGAIHARLLAELRENDYSLCVSCGYSMIGLESNDVCPECGALFDVEAARKAWLELTPGLDA